MLDIDGNGFKKEEEKKLLKVVGEGTWGKFKLKPRGSGFKKSDFPVNWGASSWF